MDWLYWRIRAAGRWSKSFALDLVAVPVLACMAVVGRWLRSRRDVQAGPRIVWGSTPLINNVSWSRAMKQAGFESECFMSTVYSINKDDDFERVLTREFTWCPQVLRPYLAFGTSLIRYDVVSTSFNGYFLTTPILSRIQAGLFALAGIKTIVMPFGSDAYVYSRIRSMGLLQGLLLSYPFAARDQKRIARNVDYWCRRADVVIPGVMGPDGFGRWDVPVPSALSVDLDEWTPKSAYTQHDGTTGPVVVGHAPNHRGFKGTEFVIDAVRRLQDEGLKVELRLIEGVTNVEVRRILHEEVDILVEQLICTGHGMNGVEGMATGLPVVCNLEDDQYLVAARRYSFFGECPLVSADPESVQTVIRGLDTNPILRSELGRLSRQYVEKYHSLDSSRYLFTAVLDFVYGRRATLSDLYHPLTSDYVRREPRIVPPLDKNRLSG